MTNKEYVSQIKVIQKNIDKKLASIEQLRAVSTTVTSSLSQDVVCKSKTINKLGVIAENIVDLERSLAFDYEKLSEVTFDINEKIQNLDNVNYQNILNYRYIKGMQYEDISRELNFSMSSIYRYHRIALSKLNIY